MNCTGTDGNESLVNLKPEMIFAEELYWWQAKNNMDERKYAILCF